MPTYDYKCTQCDTQFEARHPMNEDNPDCPVCGAKTKKMILFPPATHGYMACGREQAMRSLQPMPGKSKHTHGVGCGCDQHHDV